jgi:hypothetical protein
VGQLGHSDARLTLNVYAQVMQRQRIDEAVIWQLMRSPGEPEERSFGPRNGPTSAATRPAALPFDRG